MLSAMMQLSDAVAQIQADLQTVIDDPVCLQAETRLLVEQGLDLPWAAVYKAPETPISDRAWQQVGQWLVERIQRRVPIQYLVGGTWFDGHWFSASSAVLIPRPETELLVQTAAQAMAQHPYQRVLDLGTGSGCVIIALALRLGQDKPIQWSASDISPDALAVAQHNADRLCPRANIRWYCGEGLEPFAPNSNEVPFELIVSNPPYVNSANRARMAPEVVNHEPHLALFADDQGLAFYAQLAQTARAYLHPAGQVMVELDPEQVEPVQVLFGQHGWGPTHGLTDCNGHQRVMTIQHSP
jgi:release factor glutamine methyltransferase